MSERTLKLAQRRTALRAHCASQREELARVAGNIESRLSSVDHGINMFRRYAASPALLVGGLALLTMIGPRRLLRWVGRSAVFVTAGQRIFRLLR
ncbi:YqjK family protein [Povalibacter sp.]|uniref:YqjK family protein n=1 Tax=Povalibacter sp. TaxID=1962978 RepID=UPI002F4107D6